MTRIVGGYFWRTIFKKSVPHVPGILLSLIIMVTDAPERSFRAAAASGAVSISYSSSPKARFIAVRTGACRQQIVCYGNVESLHPGRMDCRPALRQRQKCCPALRLGYRNLSDLYLNSIILLLTAPNLPYIFNGIPSAILQSERFHQVTGLWPIRRSQASFRDTSTFRGRIH